MRLFHFYFVLLTLGSASPTLAADAKLVDFPAGLSVPFVEKGDQISARIPLVAISGSPELTDLQVQKRDVFSVEGRPGALTEQISLKWQPATMDLGPALIVSAQADDILPGTYTLVVEIFSIDSTATEIRQAATFTLQRAAPQLTSLRSVSVWQENWFWSTVNTGGHLNLREDSRKTAVRQLSVSEIRDAPAVPGPETGQLSVKPSDIRVPAGGAVQIEVVPHGNFPIGKTTGKLYLQSPHFPTSLTVDYEVTAVRTPLLIAICAAAGSLIGWLVRIFLKERRDRLAVLITASETLATLRKARRAVPDEEFVNSLVEAETALKDASEYGQTAPISAAVAAANNALAAAQIALQARRKLLEDTLGPLHRVLHQGWQLPTAAAEALGTARAVADGIHALIEVQNIKIAQERLKDQLQSACIRLANTSSQWRNDTLEYLALLAKHPPVLPDNGDIRLNEAVDTWKTQFGEARNYVVIERAELEKELAATHGGFHQTRTIADNLRAGGEIAIAWTCESLPTSDHQELFTELDTIASKYTNSLISELDSPDSASRAQLVVRQQQQKNAWKNALLASIGDADPAAVIAEIEKGQWMTAVRIARELSAAHANLRMQGHDINDVAQRSASTQPADAAPVALGIRFQTSLVESADSAAETFGRNVDLTGSVQERIVFATAERFAAFIQSLIVMVLFIALAYGFYGGRWIGTFSEMLGVFAWAFGLDLTADSLAPLLKKAGTIPNAQ